MSLARAERAGLGTRLRADWVGVALWYAAAALIAVVFLVPLGWTLSTSLRDVSNVMAFPPRLWPEEPRWENYLEIFQRQPFARWIWNTTQITLMATLGTVVSALLVAYSFARFRYPGRDLFFFLTVSTMILPTEVTIVPTYLLHRQLGWLDTYYPIVVPFWLGGSAFYIFLLRQFLLTLPRDLDDAAKIDGANGLQVFLNIMLPLSKPALATVAVISFIAHWDEFLRPLIYINSTPNFPLSVGLRYFNNRGNETDPMDHLLMAAATMVTVPCLVLFFFTQRYFVKGVVTSGIKG